MTEPPEKPRVLPLALIGGGGLGLAVTLIALTPSPMVLEPARLPAILASAAYGVLALTLAMSSARVQLARNKTARLRERVTQRELEGLLKGEAEKGLPRKAPLVSGLQDGRRRSG